MVNVNLRKKMLAGFIIVLFFLGVVTYFSYSSLNNMDNEYGDLIHRVVEAESDAKDIKFDLKGISASVRGYLLYEDEGMLGGINEYKEDLNQKILKVDSVIKVQENKQLLKEIKEAATQYQLTIDNVIKTGKSDQFEQAKKIAIDGRTYLQEAESKADQLLANEAKLSVEKDVAVSASKDRSLLYILILSAIAMIAGIISSVLIVRSISKTIRYIQEFSTKLQHSLREISATSEEIAGGNSQQAVYAERASEMVSQMNLAITEVAQNAEQASVNAEIAVKRANAGVHAIQETQKGMQDISTNINDLALKSEEIGDIIEIIDEIADQTNLLALNAAIEAARAGEAGRGFSVVADEVRKLAERSSDATKKITSLVKSIQKNTEVTVKSTEIGDELARKAGESFNEILKMVTDSSNRMTEIAAASEEQSAQSSEVQSAVHNIAAITEETASGAEEASSSTLSMTATFENLQKMLGNL